MDLSRDSPRRVGQQYAPRRQEDQRAPTRASLPRTPAVFARKTKWRRYDHSEVEYIKDNYVTVTDNVQALRAQFEQDQAEGMMCRMHLDEAQIRK